MIYKGVNFYDLDFDPAEAMAERMSLDEAIEYRDLQNRKLYMHDDITIYAVYSMVHQILQFNADDKDVPVEERKPIYIYITSRGGEVDAGFELVDTIMASKTPIYTVNLGYWYSMGLIIGMVGHKRFGMPNSTILLHDGSDFAIGTASKVQDTMDFVKKVNQRMRDLVVSKTNLTKKEYDSNSRVEWYMFADEAKKRGFIDYIIGVDCDIDEVI